MNNCSPNTIHYNLKEAYNRHTNCDHLLALRERIEKKKDIIQWRQMIFLEVRMIDKVIRRMIHGHRGNDESI